MFNTYQNIMETKPSGFIVLVSCTVMQLPDVENIKALTQRFPWVRYGHHDGQPRQPPGHYQAQGKAEEQEQVHFPGQGDLSGGLPVP